VRVERFGKAGAAERHVARVLAHLLAGGQTQLAHRRHDVRRRVGQVGHFARHRTRGDLGVAGEFGELPGADLLAEEQRGGVGQLVRFVEHDGVAVGQELRHPLVAQHHVGEEQVVVDDDDIRVECLLACLQHETIGVVGAILAETVVARGRDQRPDRRVLGNVGQFRAIAALRRARERDDLLQVARIVARRQAVLVRGAFEMVVADVVGAAFEQRDGDGHRQRIAHERQVALEQLILQRLGAGGDDDLAAVQERRHQVGKRLACAGAGFRDELAAHRDGVRDGLRHRELLGAEAKSRQRPRQRAAVAEDRVERGVVRRRLRRGLEVAVRGDVHGRLAYCGALLFGLALGSARGRATIVAAPSGAVVKPTRTDSILNESSS
jgi:hypothetical protein